jgi:hypothetical protein
MNNALNLRRKGHCALDLDNTIINYSPAFEQLAPRFGLPRNYTRNLVREHFKSEDGEDHLWQEFQSLLYTEGLNYAIPSSNLLNFLNYLQDSNVRVSIISHKTKKTQERFGAADLREPALKWLRSNGITGKYVAEPSVFFTETQSEKIDVIIRVNPDLFIDDLKEVLTELKRRHFAKVWHFSDEGTGEGCGSFQDLMAAIGEIDG